MSTHPPVSHLENGLLLESFLFDTETTPQACTMSRRSSVTSEYPQSPLVSHCHADVLYNMFNQVTTVAGGFDFGWDLLDCMLPFPQELPSSIQTQFKLQRDASSNINSPNHLEPTTPPPPPPSHTTPIISQLAFTSPSSSSSKRKTQKPKQLSPPPQPTTILDTRARNYRCSMCSNTFLRRQDLTRHEVTHTRVKEHICLVVGCGARFGRSDALARHVKGRRCV
ncbi:hypothetical protein CcCBS67573_g05709 [Chytriomyces confervae]|uniref:C2H2-type domain-containing protein n=1 Tax=Chytriomyces confervae TaxID=246404 RepID=A0A507FBD5_9FUNG|nr:hypothetical protein CcCBS67573_g05709 [Chytriomyces confervae]